MSCQTESTPWISLPLVVTDVVFNYLSAKDFGSLAQVSKSARASVAKYLKHDFLRTKTQEKWKALQEFLSAHADLLLPIELRAKEKKNFISGTSFGLFCVEEMIPKNFFKRLSIVSAISIQGRHEMLQDPFVGRTTLAMRNEWDTSSVTRNLGKIPAGAYGLILRIHVKVVRPTAQIETITINLGHWNYGQFRT